MTTARKLNFRVEDLSASLVVFLVALPLCMGIAIASGMPPSAGLISGIIGGVVVGLLSGSPLQVSGPAAGLTVVVWNIVESHGIERVGYVVLLGGLIQVIAGLLGFGRWFRAISPAVVYGMLAGIGVLIIASQFHVMVDAKPHSTGPSNLLAIPARLLSVLVGSEDGSHQTGRTALSLGALTIATIVLWGKFRPDKLKFLPAPLLGVGLAALAANLSGASVSYVSLPDNILGSLELPGMAGLTNALNGSVIAAAVTLALIASAETLLCAAAVDRMQTEVRTDYNRELFAQGVGNTLCGLLGGLPMTGVIVRSSANVEAGAKTRLSAILHGLWLLLLVAFAPFLLRLVPTASLAGVLVYTGFKLVSPAHLRELRDFGWGAIGIYGVTLAGVVAQDLLTGVLIGLGLSALRLLVTLGSFEIETKEQQSNERLDVTFRGALTFVGLPRLAATLESLPNAQDIHLHVDQLRYIDHACLVAIGDFERQARQRGQSVTIDWTDLDARSEKQLPPAAADVRQLQPST